MSLGDEKEIFGRVTERRCDRLQIGFKGVRLPPRPPLIYRLFYTVGNPKFKITLFYKRFKTKYIYHLEIVF